MIVFKKKKKPNAPMKKDGIITEVFIFNLKWIREHSECKCCTLSSSNISTLCTAYYIPSLCAASEGFSAAPGIYTVIKPSCCNTLKSVNALFYIALSHAVPLCLFCNRQVCR